LDVVRCGQDISTVVPQSVNYPLYFTPYLWATPFGQQPLYVYASMEHYLTAEFPFQQTRIQVVDIGSPGSATPALYSQAVLSANA